jgi:sec-independent protein translocase protein TatB
MEFFGIGPFELLVILLITLIVVGPHRLPEMAAELARLLRAARKYASQITQELGETMSELEKEYDDMKGEWKDVGQGLDETAKEVRGELEAAERDANVEVGEEAASPGRRPSP